MMQTRLYDRDYQDPIVPDGFSTSLNLTQSTLRSLSGGLAAKYAPPLLPLRCWIIDDDDNVGERHAASGEDETESFADAGNAAGFADVNDGDNKAEEEASVGQENFPLPMG